MGFALPPTQFVSQYRQNTTIPGDAQNITREKSSQIGTDDLKLKFAGIIRQAARNIFDLVRWITIVGVTRFLWLDTGQFVFALLYWLLSVTLFGFLAALFLLRTDIVIYARADQWWKTFANVAINFLICVVVFSLTLWFVELLTAAFAASRLA